MQRKRILVTGTGGRSVGAGILHALLRSHPEVRSRWDVVAADADPFAWGLYTASDAVLLPPAADPQYPTAVARAVERHGIDAIVPGTEVEMMPLLERQDSFLPAKVVANRAELMPLMLDKFAMARRLETLGLPTLDTLPAREWPKLADKWGFPLVVKPTRGTGGSRGLCLATSGRDIERFISTLDPRSEPCVQRYVGTAEQEYTVGVLHDANGELIDSIVIRRELTGLSLHDCRRLNGARYAVSTGYSQGYVVSHPEIQAQCEDLARRLGSVGPLNVQLRHDAASGVNYVFEIHPRFSGSTPIRADVGFNEVDLCLRNRLFGERFGRISYRTNVAAIRALEHVIVPIDQMLSQP